MWLRGRDGDVTAELGGASERRGGGGGRGGARRRAAVRSRITGREGKREPEEGERSRGRGENEGRLWVSPWRREDVGEAATAKQEVEARARARRHASASRQRLKTAVPLVGWAAKWTGRGAGPAQVSAR